MNFFKNIQLTEQFLKLALKGAEWVLWLLVALSIFSLAIIIYKGIYFITLRAPLDAFISRIRQLIRSRNLDGARKLAEMTPGVEAKVILAGLRETTLGTMEDSMLAEKIRMKMQLEKSLAFLGTLGSNAPFIGLFGTVLGIIQAFHNLDPKQNPGQTKSMNHLHDILQ